MHLIHISQSQDMKHFWLTFSDGTCVAVLNGCGFMDLYKSKDWDKYKAEHLESLLIAI